MDKQSLFPLLLSLFAGLSTVLGAIILFFSKSNNKRLITFALSFSAGVMISISFTDLYPSAQETLIKYQGPFKGVLLSLLFLIIGAFIAMLIDSFVPSEPSVSTTNSSLYKVGFVSMVALFLHNFPEGIATYISGYQDATLGITVAIAISLHNIPEGISIAMPIYYSTNSKRKAFKYTFYSGMAEPLGALLAFIFLKPFINEIILSILFALVAGIMLFISFQELIPEARTYKFNKLYIISLFIGLTIIPISHIIIS